MILHAPITRSTPNNISFGVSNREVVVLNNDKYHPYKKVQIYIGPSNSKKKGKNSAKSKPTIKIEVNKNYRKKNKAKNKFSPKNVTGTAIPKKETPPPTTDNSEGPLPTDFFYIDIAGKVEPREQAPLKKQAQPFNHKPNKLLKPFPIESTPLKEVNGLLGVEYVIKIRENFRDNSPSYYCGLCQVEISDAVSMQRHLESYDHRLLYCERHYATAVRHFKQCMTIVPQQEIFKVMSPILANLAKMIETHHGRRQPRVCSPYEFKVNRLQILSNIYSSHHASELHGPTFMHVMSTTDIDKLIENRHSFVAEPSKTSTPIFEITEEEEVYLNQIFEKQSSDTSFFEHNSNDKPNFVPPIPGINKNFSKEFTLTDLISNKSFSNQLTDEKHSTNICENSEFIQNYLNNPLENPFSEELKEKLEDYYFLVDREMAKLNEMFQEYIRTPHTIPQYEEKWTEFWQQCKLNLLQLGIDHQTYDFENDWLDHTKKLLVQLYNDEMEVLKEKVMEYLKRMFNI